MDPRDDDIEFDFFEEEPPTAEAASSSRPRLPGRGGRGPTGPRRPAGPSRGVAPLLRLVLLIIGIVALFVIFGLVLQSCASASKRSSYQKYLSKVDTIARSSDDDGVAVETALTTPGLKAADLSAKLSGIAEQERQNVSAAADLNPPGRLRQENQQIVEALELRAGGTQGLARSFAESATATSADLVAQGNRLSASDVIWADFFNAPTKAELQKQGITGVGGVPESHYVTNPDLYTATSMEGVLKRLEGASTTGTRSGLHGTNIVSTEALPDKKTLSESTSNTVTGTTTTAFVVTIHNGGDSQEVGIKITLTIQKTAGGGNAIVQTKTVDVIDPGKDKSVTFDNLGALPFAEKTNVSVDVAPVPGEQTKSNNHATYPVLFSLPSG
jgi:hypothetical protein